VQAGESRGECFRTEAGVRRASMQTSASLGVPSQSSRWLWRRSNRLIAPDPRYGGRAIGFAQWRARGRAVRARPPERSAHVPRFPSRPYIEHWLGPLAGFAPPAHVQRSVPLVAGGGTAPRRCLLVRRALAGLGRPGERRRPPRARPRARHLALAPTVGLALVRQDARPVLLAAAPALSAWHPRRRGLDPLRFLAVSPLDDAAYGVGVIWGSASRCSWRAVRPTIR
jgi:hypothetical protein